MKVSVIIPVYNVEAYVGRTLKTVFDTTASKDDFEVILVNDGTKDGSMKIVQQFSDRPNLTIIEQENQGLSAARNRGLEKAKGEYVWFVDSDDYLDENSIGTVLKLLSERISADVLMFPIRWTFLDSRDDWLDYHAEKERVVNGKSIIRDLQLPVWAAPRFVFRRSLTENPWLFFPKGLLHEDEYFGPVLMCLADKVHVMPVPIYNYVQRAGSIISSRAIQSAYDMVSIHRLLVRYTQEALDPADKMWFRQYCFGRLSLVYRHRSDWFEKEEFQRFARHNGIYAFRQWNTAFTGRTLKNKVGRLSYFLLPGFRECLFG